MNEFVSISKLMQSRKDKINSKDITESFLFILFDTSICHKYKKECKIILFLIAFDWCSPIIIFNVSSIRLLRISSINFIFQVEMGL